MTIYQAPTHDELQALVARLDARRADATRDDWVKIGMAIHDADPSDAGFQLFDEFSRQSPKYNEKNVRATWKTFKPGAVTVGTLIKFANEDTPISRNGTNGHRQVAYDYVGADGALCYQAIRYYKDGIKSFYQRRPDGHGGWVNNLDGVQRVLYNLPDVLRAVERGEPVYIVEGEKDVFTLRTHGITATTNVGGAGKWKDDYSAVLRGAHVVILPDNDKVGQDHADDIERSLRGGAATVRRVLLPGLPPKGDVSDWLEQHTIAELHAITERLAPLSEKSDSAVAVTDSARPSRFVVSSEADLMNLPPLAYLDRELCVVARAYHLIYGPSGSGKTFFAIERAMRLASAGYHVLYVPTEDLSGLRYRVAAWRKAHPDASGRLTWLHMPEGLDLQDHGMVAELLEAIEPYKYDLVTIDTLREAHNGDENSSQDTRRINRAIQSIIASGAAVDVVHHTGVAGERPRGSTALYGNNDVVIEIDNDDGQVQAVFKKLRSPQRDPLAFAIVQQDTGLLDVDGQPVPSAILRPSNQVLMRATKMTPTGRKILDALSLSIFGETGARTKQLVDAAKLSENKTFYRALSFLKDNGYISQGAKGDPYTITNAGRAQLGPSLVATVTQDTASQSPTVTTVTPLSHTVTDSATVLSVTVTTPRGDSDDSGVTGEKTLVVGKPIHKPNVNHELARRQMDQEAADMAAKYGPMEDDE